MPTLARLVAALLALFSFCATALPIEVSGEAPIVNNNEEEARQRAIDRALAQAVMSQGGMVDFNQASQNGVLQQEEMSWQSRTQVRSMELLSEQRQGDKLTVRLRVELAHVSEPNCRGLSGRAAISVPRAEVRYRDQLVPGGLYELDAALSRLLGNTLSGESHFAFAKVRDDLRLDLIPPQPHWITELGQQDGSQYVLNVIIDDVSVDQPKKRLGWFERTANRTIALEARLYDSFSGERVWQQRYRSAADWPYKRQEIADTATERFWSSEFGEELRRLTFEMVADVDGLLTCQPLKGRIVQLSQETVILDLGLRNGIRPGDQLELVHQQGAWGSDSGLVMTVEQVHPESARARLDGASAMMGVQRGDWVQRVSRR
ncbi:flagellar assembly protein T N-terminal domain-containing protein [Ferrimonas marina]|uniref:Flagellar assembly protein T, C-terminal domain n=1 Tax=Ferrimonas marina TaxID=299255 RepID=A0A1M5YB52_9GAMM|nr:flagellar assembly protein T N-terminal domain-containing protein [Ferrimonas marina]SHI09310.1 Flagellar assembly protein T, C-terminal domain [Ferrimonas marina]